MSICSNELNKSDCPKINATEVDAYINFALSSENPTTLYLDHSWGCTSIDLRDIIKNGETITTMFLSPRDNPDSIQYNREDYGRDLTPDGGVDCIHGDDLSRIISMQLLKDVDQNQPMKDGNVYIFNGETGKFEPWDLQKFADDTNATLHNHEDRITQREREHAALVIHVDELQVYFQRLIDALTRRVEIIEEKITPPAGCPANARIVHGNINLYSDYTGASGRNWGLYSHSLSSTIANDEVFG